MPVVNMIPTAKPAIDHQPGIKRQSLVTANVRLARLGHNFVDHAAAAIERAVIGVTELEIRELEIRRALDVLRHRTVWQAGTVVDVATPTLCITRRESLFGAILQHVRLR